MKKEQKNLSPFELEVEKFVKKNADNKKLKNENFHNKISVIFETFIQEIPKAKLTNI